MRGKFSLIIDSIHKRVGRKKQQQKVSRTFCHRHCYRKAVREETAEAVTADTRPENFRSNFLARDW